MALVVEGLVILASTLAAFLPEDWRADRELARDLTQELERVHRELDPNRVLVSAELGGGGEYLMALLDDELAGRW